MPAFFTAPFRTVHCVIVAVCFASTAWADYPPDSPQGQIVTHMGDPLQGRAVLTFDPVLSQVAQSRAQDMAKRRYFGHVNPDGHAINFLVKQAGYSLPAFYAQAPKDNNLESIAAGYTTADATWNAWMQDIGEPAKPHRQHLLARTTNDDLIDFFAQQTCYGVGYYFDPASPFRFYWVVVTAPPARLGFTSPENNVLVNGSSISISGTASASSGTAVVKWQLVNTSGSSGWNVANGAASWSATVDGLVTGVNTIFIESFDAGNNAIAVANRTVIRPNPFLLVRGRYAGLALTGSNDHLASLRAVVTAHAAITGRLNLDGHAFGFAGAFDPDGDTTIIIPRPGIASLTLALHLDLQNGTDQLTGTLTDGSTFTAQIDANRAVFNATSQTTPNAGRYTMIIAANASDASAPQGNGYAVINVLANGNAVIAGNMADGTHFSTGSMVSKTGELPLFLLFPHHIGIAAGVAQFESLAQTDIDGQLIWNRRPGGTFFPNGFATTVPLIGSHYAVLSNGSVLNFGAASPNGVAVLNNGGLPNEVDLPIALTSNNMVTMIPPGPPALTLHFNPHNGVFSGTFIDPGANAQRTARGAALQKQNTASGYFPGTATSGSISLNAVP